MGLAGYFRKFVPGFATKTASITYLTKQGVPFEWKEEQEMARKYIIECLTSRPLLIVYVAEFPTELHTNASSVSYGAVLIQKRVNQPKVVEYFSKRTTEHVAKYHSYELETLAVVRALKHFRIYLLGIRFTLVTDYNAVKASATKKDLIPGIARWWMYLQDFTFDIAYRKGDTLTHGMCRQED